MISRISPKSKCIRKFSQILIRSWISENNTKYQRNFRSFEIPGKTNHIYFNSIVIKDIQAIFFDFDGTIADTEEIHFKSFNRVLEKFGLEISWQEYLEKYLAYTDQEFFKKISEEKKIEIDINEACKLKQEYTREDLKHAKPLPGVIEAIKYFKKKYPLCIVSGALKEEIEFILKNFGILDMFEEIVSGDDYDEGKPSPKPFEIAIEKMKKLGYKINNELCVAFEDSGYGIISAKKTGLLAVGITTFYSQEKLKESGADIVINSLIGPEEIEEKIKSLLKTRILEGDKVLLVSHKKNKTFLITADKKNDIHTHLGIIKGIQVVGNYYGRKILSSKGESFYLLEPTLEDRIKKIERKSAIIYSKDSSIMIFLSGISSGSRVIETGCGSGGMTLALAHFIKPTGKVFVYEIRDDFIELTKRNLEKNNLLEYVEFKKRDIYKEEFDERDIDAVFIDLPEPWHCIRAAWKSLKPSGVLISVSPTVNQTEIFCELLRANGFILVDTFEVLLRRFLSREGKSRPYEDMIGHTAYISIGRKVLDR